MGNTFFNIPVYLSQPAIAGNSQNPFVFSDDVMLKMPAIKSFQDVFHHDKFTANQFADGITQHFVAATERFVEAAEHLAEATEHPAEATRHLAETTEHPAEATKHPEKSTRGYIAATKCMVLRNYSPIILSRFINLSNNH
jgi:hypothetical protein